MGSAPRRRLMGTSTLTRLSSKDQRIPSKESRPALLRAWSNQDISVEGTAARSLPDDDTPPEGLALLLLGSDGPSPLSFSPPLSFFNSFINSSISFSDLFFKPFTTFQRRATFAEASNISDIALSSNLLFVKNSV